MSKPTKAEIIAKCNAVMNRQINESEQREKTIALAREEAMKKELMRKKLWQMSRLRGSNVDLLQMSILQTLRGMEDILTAIVGE